MTYMGYTNAQLSALEAALENAILTKEFGEEVASIHQSYKKHVPAATIAKNHNVTVRDVEVIHALAAVFLENYGREAAEDTQPLDPHEQKMPLPTEGDPSVDAA